MGKKKSPKAPEYQNTTYSTGGLFGDTTTTKEGTTFNPNSSMSRIGGMAWQGLGNSLNNLNRTDFSKDKNYQVYSNNLQRQMRDNFNNNVLSGIANNGLMRSSGLQAATNAFNDTLANQTANLYDSYYNRQAQSLANYQNTLNSLYNYLSGVSGLGMNANSLVNNFNQNNFQNKLAAQKNNSNLWGSIAGLAGSAIGTAFAPGVGTAIGGQLGSALGGVADGNTGNTGNGNSLMNALMGATGGY